MTVDLPLKIFGRTRVIQTSQVQYTWHPYSRNCVHACTNGKGIFLSRLEVEFRTTEARRIGHHSSEATCCIVCVARQGCFKALNDGDILLSFFFSLKHLLTGYVCPSYGSFDSYLTWNAVPSVPTPAFLLVQVCAGFHFLKPLPHLQCA